MSPWFIKSFNAKVVHVNLFYVLKKCHQPMMRRHYHSRNIFTLGCTKATQISKDEFVLVRKSFLYVSIKYTCFFKKSKKDRAYIGFEFKTERGTERVCDHPDLLIYAARHWLVHYYCLIFHVHNIAQRCICDRDAPGES